MREALDDLALQQRVPVLGVCVGMQMLAAPSDEGSLPGLGWIDGDVVRFDALADGQTLPLPHMGWNDVRVRSSSDGLFERLDARRAVLFSPFLLLRLRSQPRTTLARLELRRASSPAPCRARQHLRRAVSSGEEPSTAEPGCCRTSRSCDDAAAPHHRRACWCTTAASSRPCSSERRRTSAIRSMPSRSSTRRRPDELIVLDIDATRARRRARLQADRAVRRRVPHAALLRRRRSRRSSRRERIIGLGVEKVAISSAAIENPPLIPADRAGGRQPERRRRAGREAGPAATLRGPDAQRDEEHGIGRSGRLARRPRSSAPARSSSTRSTTTG